MRVLGLVLAIVVATAGPQPSGRLAAQEVAAQMDGRVSPDVARAVRSIAQDAAARGLPVEPLVQKAIEGGAKGVPDDRVVAAVRLVAARLDRVLGALREAGIATPSPDAVERGAEALNAGLNVDHIRDLGRVSRPPYDLALTLNVAVALAALEVPPHQGVQLMRHMIQAGRAPQDLVNLPNDIQLAVARGATPTGAVEELDASTGQHGEQGQQGRQGEQGQQEQAQQEQQGQEGRSVHRP